jgi:hypothetical protein
MERKLRREVDCDAYVYCNAYCNDLGGYNAVMYYDRDFGTTLSIPISILLCASILSPSLLIPSLSLPPTPQACAENTP